MIYQKLMFYDFEKQITYIIYDISILTCFKLHVPYEIQNGLEGGSRPVSCI